jgi:hypothetical protein
VGKDFSFGVPFRDLQPHDLHADLDASDIEGKAGLYLRGLRFGGMMLKVDGSIY